MSYEAYYGKKRATGATQTTVVNLGEGLNEYMPPVSLRDGQLSASRNMVSNDGISLSCIPYVAPTTVETFTSTDLLAVYNGGLSNVYPLFVDKTTFLAKNIETLTSDTENSTILYNAGTQNVALTTYDRDAAAPEVAAPSIIEASDLYIHFSATAYGTREMGVRATVDLTPYSTMRITWKVWALSASAGGAIFRDNADGYVRDVYYLNTPITGTYTYPDEPATYTVTDLAITATGVQDIEIGGRCVSYAYVAVRIAKIELIGASTFDVSANAFNANPLTSGAVKYITAADNYSIYWSQMENFLLVQAHSTRAVSTVTLPSGVYPISCVHHVNRIFILDTRNYLWWCKAGDYTTWYGSAISTEYKAEDAGYWLVASGDTMNQIIVFRENLYIFGSNSIYLFSGYSSETFALQKLFSGIGSYTWAERSLCANNNMLFFTYKDKVYEFDGNSIPSVISEPVVSNGSFSNGILGGIKPNTGFASVADNVRGVYADETYLYLYPFSARFAYLSTSTTFMFPLCMFDIRRKTWWKRDGFPVTTAQTGAMYIYPAIESTGLSWARTLTQTSITTINLCTTLSSAPSLATLTSKFVTKAFALKPSDILTLSDIYVVYKNATSANVTLDVEMSASGDNTLANFTETLYNTEFVQTTGDTHNLTNYVSGGKPEVLRIPVYNCNNKLTMALANSPFFRIMFTVTASAIDILRIELRYRAKGASR